MAKIYNIYTSFLKKSFGNLYKLTSNITIDCLNAPLLEPLGVRQKHVTRQRLIMDITTPRLPSPDNSSDLTYSGGTETTNKVQANKPTELYKIVIVGDSRVGKSSLMKRLCDNTYMDMNCSTILVESTMPINSNPALKDAIEEYVMQLNETACQYCAKGLHLYNEDDGTPLHWDDSPNEIGKCAHCGVDDYNSNVTNKFGDKFCTIECENTYPCW